MIIADERVNFTCLSMRLLDPANDEPTLPDHPTEAYSAEIGTGNICIYMQQTFLETCLVLDYRPDERSVPGSLPGIVHFSSGDLWVEEVPIGSKRLGPIEPGTYSVHVSFPDEVTTNPQRYEVIVFNRM